MYRQSPRKEFDLLSQSKERKAEADRRKWERESSAKSRVKDRLDQRNYYRAGDLICEEGERPRCIYELKQGRVGIFCHQERADSVVEETGICSFGTHICDVQEPGSYLGLSGLLYGIRTASIRALEDNTYVEPVALRKTGIRHLICSNPERGLRLCRSLARQFVDVSPLVKKETSLIPALQRTRDLLAMAYVHLVDQADRAAANSATSGFVRKDVAVIRESPLYLTGKACITRSIQVHEAFATALKRHEARRRNLNAGEVIQYGMELGTALSLVQEGTLEIWAEHHHVSTLIPGSTLGEVAVFLKELPVPSVMLKAVTEVKLVYLPAIEFADMGRHHTNLLVTAAHILGERLESIHRFVRNPDEAARKDLDLLTGSEGSCAEILSDFARILPADDVAMTALSTSALALAAQARSDRQALSATFGEILAICGITLHDRLDDSGLLEAAPETERPTL